MNQISNETIVVTSPPSAELSSVLPQAGARSYLVLYI